LVKNCIVQIDASPFRVFFEQKYGVSLGKAKKAEVVKEGETKKIKTKGLSIQKLKRLQIIEKRRLRNIKWAKKLAARTRYHMKIGKIGPKRRSKQYYRMLKEGKLTKHGAIINRETWVGVKRPLKSEIKKGDKPYVDPRGPRKVSKKAKKEAEKKKGKKVATDKRATPSAEKTDKKASSSSDKKATISDKKVTAAPADKKATEKKAVDKKGTPVKKDKWAEKRKNLGPKGGGRMKKVGKDGIKPIQVRKSAAHWARRREDFKRRANIRNGRRMRDLRRRCLLPIRKKTDLRLHGKPIMGADGKQKKDKYGRPAYKSLKFKHWRHKIEKRFRVNYRREKKYGPIDNHLVEQFQKGRLFACISSRPGQSGVADGYILEGNELQFYLKKMQKKKGTAK